MVLLRSLVHPTFYLLGTLSSPFLAGPFYHIQDKCLFCSLGLQICRPPGHHHLLTAPLRALAVSATHTRYLELPRVPSLAHSSPSLTFVLRSISGNSLFTLLFFLCPVWWHHHPSQKFGSLPTTSSPTSCD